MKKHENLESYEFKERLDLLFILLKNLHGGKHSIEILKDLIGFNLTFS